jgi:coenzyme F420-reducing hydrogenase beta subunit
MIEIKDKAKCCGCTACVSICPKNCIEMESDFEGFLYPKVNEDICIDCGMCERVCPILNKKEACKFALQSYVVRTKEYSVLLASTSGGFITPLAEWVVNCGGVMCGAVYDNNFYVSHEIIGEGYSRLQGSKYVQSNLNDCFLHIKEHLEYNQMVCFIGTTCQVYGLKSYLGKDYINLLTVDLVCHGVPSPKLWDKYLEFQKNKYRSDITEVSFRNKTYGYHSGTMKIKFSNGKVYYGSARVDPMLKSFFTEIASRPSCYKCNFKTVNRCSDFTIYDCWHAAQLVKGIKDDDKGYTNLVVQSKKGLEVLKEISDRYEIYQTDTDRAIELDGSMVCHSAIPHQKREDYYKGLDNEQLDLHIKKFIPVSKKDKFIERSKFVIYRLGVYNILKSVLR